MKVGGELSNSLQPVWLALSTGILLFLSFPGAVGLWPLAWIALVQPICMSNRRAVHMKQ